MTQDGEEVDFARAIRAVLGFVGGVDFAFGGDEDLFRGHRQRHLQSANVVCGVIDEREEARCERRDRFGRPIERHYAGGDLLLRVAGGFANPADHETVERIDCAVGAIEIAGEAAFAYVRGSHERTIARIPNGNANDRACGDFADEINIRAVNVPEDARAITASGIVRRAGR